MISVKLLLLSIGAAFSADKTIANASGSQAYIDKIDSDNLYYHQNEATGFGSFSAGESISETDGSGTGVIATDSSGEFNSLTGDILYIDNRAAVTRVAEQTEDIKIVIQL
jgi:hypothetical protein